MTRDNILISPEGNGICQSWNDIKTRHHIIFPHSIAIETRGMNLLFPSLSVPLTTKINKTLPLLLLLPLLCRRSAYTRLPPSGHLLREALKAYWSVIIWTIWPRSLHLRFASLNSVTLSSPTRSHHCHSQDRMWDHLLPGAARWSAGVEDHGPVRQDHRCPLLGPLLPGGPTSR